MLHIEIKKAKGKQKIDRRSLIGMLAMEYKKLLITNKGILMLLVLCIIQGAILSNVNTTIDATKSTTVIIWMILRDRYQKARKNTYKKKKLF